MLVLTRRRGESVIITVPPSDRETVVEVVVTETVVEGGKTRLGFVADRSVAILRSELEVDDAGK